MIVLSIEWNMTAFSRSNILTNFVKPEVKTKSSMRKMKKKISNGEDERLSLRKFLMMIVIIINIDIRA